MPNSFGKFLRDERRKRAWSLKELGDKLQSPRGGGAVSPQYLNDLEHDRRSPSPELLGQMASLLGVELEILQGLALRGSPAVEDYLAGHADRGPEVGRVFRRAKEVGFTDWQEVQKVIDDAAKRKKRPR